RSFPPSEYRSFPLTEVANNPASQLDRIPFGWALRIGCRRQTKRDELNVPACGRRNIFTSKDHRNRQHVARIGRAHVRLGHLPPVWHVGRLEEPSRGRPGRATARRE